MFVVHRSCSPPRAAALLVSALSACVGSAPRVAAPVAHADEPAPVAALASPGRAAGVNLSIAELPAEAACSVRPQPKLREEPELIVPDERVPDFLLASPHCKIFDSSELVGKQPFVVVFFASWCSVCEHKMPELSAALEERKGELMSMFVSLDDPSAWADTEAFLERYGQSPSAAVAGQDFLGFSLGYNPFRSVPVVVVVGRSGRVVDVQIGVRDGDEERLALALDAAIDESPASAELTSYRRP